jgi:ArsR family metal-binding transcriptional regulator
MKDIKKFTYHELINELRERKYALSIWSIEDIDMTIEDMKDDDECKDINLSEEQKYKILVDLFEDNDKSDDFDCIKIKIMEIHSSL